MMVVLIAVALAAAATAWWRLGSRRLPEGFASGNGRVEATEIDIAPKIPGRVKEINAREGDFVTAGQVLAMMDTDTLQAQRREAEARAQRARSSIDTAKSRVKQAEADRVAATAFTAQREAELDAARRHLARSERLAPRGVVSAQTYDDDRARVRGSEAAVSAAEAQVAAADAGLATARSEVLGAEAELSALLATIDRIQVDIDDSALRTPRDGRVQYRVAEPGEVLGAGGVVLNLFDLGDGYMTFFRPTAQAGRVSSGSEVRLVLDAIPQFVLPAEATFVASVAQFTPRTIETEEEREKLMFRIKARVDPELLRRHVTRVKTGLPGVAYVRLDPNAAWPDWLAVRVPQ